MRTKKIIVSIDKENTDIQVKEICIKLGLFSFIHTEYCSAIEEPIKKFLNSLKQKRTWNEPTGKPSFVFEIVLPEDISIQADLILNSIDSTESMEYVCGKCCRSLIDTVKYFDKGLNDIDELNKNEKDDLYKKFIKNIVDDRFLLHCTQAFQKIYSSKYPGYLGNLALLYSSCSTVQEFHNILLEMNTTMQHNKIIYEHLFTEVLAIAENVYKISKEDWLTFITKLSQQQLTDSQLLGLISIANVLNEQNLWKCVNKENIDLLFNTLDTATSQALSTIQNLQPSDLSNMTADDFGNLCRNNFYIFDFKMLPTFKLYYCDDDNSVGEKILQICSCDKFGEDFMSLVKNMNRNAKLSHDFICKFKQQDFANCKSVKDVWNVVKQKMPADCDKNPQTSESSVTPHKQSALLSSIISLFNNNNRENVEQKNDVDIRP